MEVRKNYLFIAALSSLSIGGCASDYDIYPEPCESTSLSVGDYGISWRSEEGYYWYTGSGHWVGRLSFEGFDELGNLKLLRREHILDSSTQRGFDSDTITLPPKAGQRLTKEQLDIPYGVHIVEIFEDRITVVVEPAQGCPEIGVVTGS